MRPRDRRLFPPALLVITFLLTANTALPEDNFPPPDSEGGWRTAADAEQVRKLAGMDPHQLDLAFDFTQRCSQNGGLLVVRHGYPAYEKYFGRAHRDANPDMASTGKAYTSVACGIMLHEFHDTIPEGHDTKVFTEQYLPEAFPLDDPRKANITLGHLLCMTADYNGPGCEGERAL
jgi:CubicO group peptidase (beta-lactamase class C family)